MENQQLIKAYPAGGPVDGIGGFAALYYQLILSSALHQNKMPNMFLSIPRNARNFKKNIGVPN